MKWQTVVGLALAACAGRTEPAPTHGKPVAPVTARLEAHGADVTLVATTTADVAGLVLRLDGQRAVFGATPAGTTRTLVVRIALPSGQGRDLVGVVEAAGRTRAVSLRFGAPAIAAAPPPLHVVNVPGLGGVAEVRP